MTFEQLKKYITILDLPSGAVLGIHTLIMIILSVVAVVFRKEIPTTVITIYGMVLGGFCVHKTTTSTTAIINNSTETTAGNGK